MHDLSVRFGRCPPLSQKGRRLIRATTFLENGARRWVRISRSGAWANRWFFRSDPDPFGLEAQRLFDDERLRLAHVEMLE